MYSQKQTNTCEKDYTTKSKALYLTLPIKLRNSFDLYTDNLMDNEIISSTELNKAIDSYELEHYNSVFLVQNEWIQFTNRVYVSMRQVCYERDNLSTQVSNQNDKFILNFPLLDNPTHSCVLL
jgi:hypothetical protein